MKKTLAYVVALICAVSLCNAQRIEVTLPSTKPLNGHLILVIAKTNKSEPRMQLSETYDSAQGFGVDVENLAPGTPLVIDSTTFGYPRRSLADLEAGDYYVQAVFNVYEQFHLASGKTVWLPPDKGEGQHWNEKPGNPYNKPAKIHFDPKAQTAIKITLDQVIPPIEGTPQDPQVIAQQQPTAKWLKFERFRSPKLSAFWGRDMFLGAWILLPDGFDEHPDARYPVIVYQDHYHPAVGPAQFTATPPDAASSQNRRLQSGYRLFQDWTSNRLPRVILIYVQNANPYYDDSYAVDSASVGPYGSAINDELIPVHRKEISRHRSGLGTRHLRRIDRRLGGSRHAGLLSRLLQRRLCRLSRPRRLPRLPEHQPLRRRQRLRPQGRLRPDSHCRRSQARRHHHRGGRCRVRIRIRPRHPRPLHRTVGHLAGRLFTRGRRRLSRPDHRSAYRRHRQEGSRLLARSL